MLRMKEDVRIELWLVLDVRWLRMTVSLEAMEYSDHNNDTVIINQHCGAMVLLITTSRLRCRGRWIEGSKLPTHMLSRVLSSC